MEKVLLNRFLAHFAGPKGENQALLVNLVDQVLLDYIHWRRNYFPQDEPIITPTLQRQFEDEASVLQQNVDKMLAGLRRSFPFYSPRYIAHQQSETSMASVIGMLAGSLYNSNNVTPESGIVTVEWEIEACNRLLEMIGYDTPPSPPENPKETDSYFKSLEKGFAWCHLTSGGTVANIEALWVARHVRYFPLAAQDVCSKHSISLDIKTPSGRITDIRNEERITLLRLKPNESIYMLGKLVNAIKKTKGCSIEEANKWTWDWLENSEYSLSRGVGRVFSEFPPIILASGSAHYSINKAADILGLGKDAVEIVDMDSSFRLDIKSLREKLIQVAKKNHCVVATVAVAGTTEEGAIDPIHKILDLRRELELSDQSFWLHIDAAWGGFLRCLYIYDSAKMDFNENIPKEVFVKRLGKVAKKIGYEFKEDTSDLISNIVASISQSSNLRGSRVRSQLEDLIVKGNYKRVLGTLRNIFEKRSNDRNEDGPPNKISSLNGKDFIVDRRDLIDCVGDFVSERIEISLGEYNKEITIRWADHDVGTALCAIERGNSITIDPHKMGYSVYPCGAIAFKNDRVRHFVTQQAPYITSNKTDLLLHKPPRHSTVYPTEFDKGKISTNAFAPFTLEGSRPSASACSLWLSSKSLPLDRDHHGTIIRSALLAARTLFEWLVHWDTAVSFLEEDVEFEFTPYNQQQPDSNIIIFGVKKKNVRSILKFNELSQNVYNHFSIQSELGENEYSYAQPFFLSKTWFREPLYPYSTVKRFLDKNNFRNSARDYSKNGLIALRASVMNPYILPLQVGDTQNIVKEFMVEIHAIAQTEAKKI